MERIVIAICIAAVLIAFALSGAIQSNGLSKVRAACLESGRYVNWRGTCLRYD